MRATFRHLLLLALALLWLAPAPALAQDEDEDEEAGFAEGEDGGDGDGNAEDGEGPAWDLPRVLVVRERRTPTSLFRAVRRIASQVGEVVDAGAHTREARSRGLPPTSDEAFEQLLPDAGVVLVMVVERTWLRRIPHLRVVYREGRFGMVLLEEMHALAGSQVPEAAEERILSELRLAMAVTTRPRGQAGAEAGPGLTLPEAPPEHTGPARDPGAVVRLGLTAGTGFGMRELTLPTVAGDIRLSTSPFPAAELRLHLEVEPVARGKLRYGFELRYLSSVALRSTDRRIDGSTRQTSSRSQALEASLTLGYRFGESLSAAALEMRLGWAFRIFSSEAAVTLPDYSLSGPSLYAGLRVPLADGRVTLAAGPQVHLVVIVDDSLERQGIGSPTLAIGGEGRVHLALSDAVGLEVLYRESHALLESPLGGASEVERFGTLSLVYVP